jgi:sensor domain CHASE-containing protein
MDAYWKHYVPVTGFLAKWALMALMVLAGFVVIASMIH